MARLRWPPVRPLHIAMVTETYPPEVNGVARTVGLMAEGLQKRGHSVQLVRPRQNGHDHAASGPRFEEILGRGIPIPRYTQLKMGLPAKGEFMRAWRLRRPRSEERRVGKERTGGVTRYDIKAHVDR